MKKSQWPRRGWRRGEGGCAQEEKRGYPLTLQREEAGGEEDERYGDPQVRKKPWHAGGEWGEVRGGERSLREETELKMGRQGEAGVRRGWRDAPEAERGRAEYRERGAGVRAKEEADSAREGGREGYPFWGW